MTAIHRYVEGAFRLFDPKTENDQAKFPRFLMEEPCPWAGKYFHELEPKMRNKFKQLKLMLAIIKSNDTNEVRDLFIRLQSGTALNAQERRDAMPGGMTDFVLRLGGKPDIIKYPGHDFFREAMNARPGSDRGKTRQLAAQITSLLLAQQRSTGAALPDINATAIDHLYHENLDFDPDGAEGRLIWEVFDLLHRLLRDGKRPKLRGHDAIHAALFVNRLRDNFTPPWEDEFALALDKFLSNLKGADKVEQDDQKYSYWSQYGIWIRSNSDRGESISRRHSFYVARMLEKMPSTEVRDSKRQFSQGMRELIYYQQNKVCAVCGGIVRWDDAEIHHVKEHKNGGKTAVENAALVHSSCHPKSKEEVARFAEEWAKYGPHNMLRARLDGGIEL